MTSWVDVLCIYTSTLGYVPISEITAAAYDLKHCTAGEPVVLDWR